MIPSVSTPYLLTDLLAYWLADGLAGRLHTQLLHRRLLLPLRWRLQVALGHRDLARRRDLLRRVVPEQRLPHRGQGHRRQVDSIL